MSKLMAGLALLFLLLAPDVNYAKGRSKGGTSNSGTACSESKFEHCLNKCISRGGHGKHLGSNKACSKHCTKKKKC